MNDRIEKEVRLGAPRQRVWRAISQKSEFGAWFGVTFEGGPFEAGELVRGRITYPGYEHVVMEIEVVEVVPETRLSYRWHPYAVEEGVDYASEVTTLVTFTLEDDASGTLVRLVESGFDALPAARRDEAWRRNDGGWSEQMRSVASHVDG